VRRLSVIFGGLIGVLLIPLGLSGPTAWLLIPAHFGFTVVATTGAVIEGLLGHAERARLWGLFYLVTTLAMAGTLELATLVRGDSIVYWVAPWLGALLWGWIPPVVSGVAGVFGEERARNLVRRSVQRRRRSR
jgi:hypothetical protein